MHRHGRGPLMVAMRREALSYYEFACKAVARRHYIVARLGRCPE